MENHTAKNFVLQLGSVVTLYLSLSFLLVLLFGLINLIYPDATEGSWAIDSAASSIRLGIAMTIVFFPTYLILTRLVNKSRRKDAQAKYLGLTKWLIYLSLLVGGLALLIDLVVVIMTFLEGEITQRFIYKASSVLVVVGAAFHYYLLDAKGYWLKQEQKSIFFGIGASILVAASVIFGFTHIAAPTEVREQKLDATQISDLQNIQWRVQDYLTLNGVLPATLADIETQIPVQTAPEGRPAYIYAVTDNGFKLCATFAKASLPDEFSFAGPITVGQEEKGIILNPDNWEHGTGEVCFERVVK